MNNVKTSSQFSTGPGTFRQCAQDWSVKGLYFQMTEIKAVFAGKQTACQQVGDTAAVNQPRSLSTQGHTSAARCSVRPDDAARSTSLSPQKPEQRCVRRCRKENCTRGPRARTSTRTRTAGGCSRSGESYCRSSDNARKGWKTVTNPSSWRTSTCSSLSNDRPYQQRAQSVWFLCGKPQRRH